MIDINGNFHTKFAKDWTAPKRPLSRNIFEKEEQQEFENIFTLPPKKSRKAALDKLKILEKEAVDLDAKMQGIDLLISVYANQVVCIVVSCANILCIAFN